MHLKYIPFYSVALLLISWVMFFPQATQAQWGENPDENLVISLKQLESLQPKIALNPADGGAYVSWFELSGFGGYHVFLQRLDAQGNILWNPNGIRVAQRNFTSTQDYGLAADAAGNAVLAFRDDRRGGERITAAKYSPDGTALWGAIGIDVSGAADFVAAPAVAATTDGGYVVAYTGAGPSVVVKLDASGDILWTREETAAALLSVSDITASDTPGEAGEVIVLFRTLGPPTVPGRLTAQKYTADGTRLWGENRAEIMNSGSLQLGNFPNMSADGAGGMLVSWYQSQPALQSYVQQVLADGSFRFPQNGLQLSFKAGQLRTDPSAVLDPETGDVYAFWRETSGNQNLIGLYGQRVSGEGTRAWGDDGRQFIPLGSTNIGNIRAAMIGGEALVAWMTAPSFTENTLQAARLDADGNYVWASEAVTLAPGAGSKNRLSFTNAGSDEVFFVWEDERTGVRGIYGQNLQADGSLGPVEDPEPDPTPVVTFQVDMSVQQLKGDFDLSLGDRVHVLGSFNGWSVSDESALAQDPEQIPEIFVLTTEIEQETGTTIAYKFYIEAGDGRPLPNDGWEGSVGPGDNGNREFVLEEEVVLPVVFFNNEDEYDTSLPERENPFALVLHQNYPNPFNPGTQIAYELPEAGEIRVEVYNTVGQQVAVLFSGRQAAGAHQLYFDAGALSSGIYLLRLQAGDQVLTRKMTLLK